MILQNMEAPCTSGKPEPIAPAFVTPVGVCIKEIKDFNKIRNSYTSMCYNNLGKLCDSRTFPVWRNHI